MQSQPEKPPRLPVQVENIPEELKTLPQWCLWRWEWKLDKEKQGRWTKPPYQPNGRLAKSDEPNTWFPFTDVLRAYKNGVWDGIGFMLTPPYVGGDLDKCIDREGKPKDWASAILRQFKTYSETSPSRTGYKFLCKAILLKGHHNEKIG